MALNAAALDQARAYAIGIEDLLTLRIEDLSAASSDVTSLAGGWNGKPQRVPLPGGGGAEGTIRDGSNCFNLNSLVEGEATTGPKRREAGVDQFAGLMRVLGIPESKARELAGAAADWADWDSDTSPDGAEDRAYAAGEPTYRAANTLFADPTELRAVAGMTPELYRTLRPFVCALPVTDLSPVNVNTLVPDQAPILAMLGPEQAPVERLRELIAARPAGGWRDMEQFWTATAAAGLASSLDRHRQLRTKTSWFTVDLMVRFEDAEVEERALVDARLQPARIVSRRWGAGE
jgi:general secretion pathway protein K